ncbi:MULTISPECIES: GNAT family N-acetyltransferase [Streptococcus]|uniref:Acetyltransferase n=1 Tax=Streptococcus sanguinis TaxID=1305 RepID=A0A2X3XH78_STRSA|nr:MULTISPECIES: GNAT family N-acetyltransferase [Streptococcus]EGJ44733.1 acetyltransferase [Streptococcus sanguinis SK1059]EGQ21382.1 acetyltransferase [Streptococcus sanguinis ATCC 29667]EGQ24268.1 acetyltransferase [Streptococcus sanguinis SK340]MBZ2024895.1 GNAT family N-acetyltransferase [Streptococcus sanguinis]MBZ2061093.1 GNAT family N-acetyltransferase [Streptococcus sanguinis]
MTEIRPLKPEGIPLLEEFLYQAIFIPQGLEPLPRSILKEPDLEMYIKDFGQQLMTAMLDLLKVKGYPSVSLSVSKDNPAAHFYKRLGFVTVEEREDDYLMLCRL